MAKVTIEIEDQPNGELRVHFVGGGLRTAATMESNTAAQNAAIYLAQQMVRSAWMPPTSAASKDGKRGSPST